MSRRNLGDMGEGTLPTWASQVGISVNKANPDRTGWDFLLEFPCPHETRADITLPLDREPGPLQCLVQVKSTDSRSGKRSVKLSNWVRLVRSPLPCFFLVLEFDTLDTCQRGYLVHVDKSSVYRVLKRLRELHADQSVKLHKRKLQFKYDDRHRLQSLDGTGLERAIRTHVGSDLAAYAERKVKQIRGAGYEDANWALKVHAIPLPGLDGQEYLVDFLLGLIPHLDTVRIEARDLRFGIKAPEPTNVIGQKGQLEIIDRKPVGTGTVALGVGTRQLRLSTKVYVPQGVAFDLDRQHVKARFAAPGIDFLFWLYDTDKCELKYTLPAPDENLPLSDIWPLAQLLLILSEAHSLGSPVEFSARYEASSLGAGSITPTSEVSGPMLQWARAVDYAWVVAKHFNIHNDVKATASEIVRHLPQLKLMALAVSPAPASARIIIESPQRWAAEGHPVCVPYVAEAPIDHYRAAMSIAFMGVLAAAGSTECGGIQYLIETDNIRLCDTEIWERDEEPRRSPREMAQTVAQDFTDTTTVLTLAGVNDHLLGAPPAQVKHSSASPADNS